MINQTSVQDKEKTILGAIPLCSKCVIHEINSWIADKRGSLDPEASQQVREELKAVKLKPGECVVCNHTLISDNTFENILKILSKHKADSKVVEEFKKLFSFMV